MLCKPQKHSRAAQPKEAAIHTKVTPSVMNIFLLSNHFSIFSLSQSAKALSHREDQTSVQFINTDLISGSKWKAHWKTFSLNIKLLFMSLWGFDDFDWTLPTVPTEPWSHFTGRVFISRRNSCNGFSFLFISSSKYVSGDLTLAIVQTEHIRFL